MEATTDKRLVNGIPVKVLEQYHKIRCTGLANMMDRKEVMELAHVLDCYYLEDWIRARGGVGYVEVLTAYTEWRRGE